jgi:hypothetical protein
VNFDGLFSDFGKPLLDPRVIVVSSLEQIFAAMYEDTYERMCSGDHLEVSRVSAAVAERARHAAEQTFLAAWSKFQNAELCALVSDDLRALTCISESSPGLSAFQAQRYFWYERGRLPCGYSGEFPNGKWVVA